MMIEKMKIEKRVIEVERFAVDGKEFDTEDEAKQYVKDIYEKLSRVYCLVSVKPDLSEGRGYYDRIILSAPSHIASNAIYQYLMNEYGKPVSMVQGVSPMATYSVGEMKTFDNFKDLNEFINAEYSTSLGSFTRHEKLQVIELNETGKIVSVK